MAGCAPGFLGTPLVLPALADAGRCEEAYLMLLREEMPSWLYQVRAGRDDRLGTLGCHPA